MWDDFEGPFDPPDAEAQIYGRLFKFKERLFFESIQKAAVFEWEVKELLECISLVLFVLPLKTKNQPPDIFEIRKPNGDYKSFNDLITMMFKQCLYLSKEVDGYCPFSDNEKKILQRARLCRNKLFHFQFKELLEEILEEKQFKKTIKKESKNAPQSISDTIEKDNNELLNDMKNQLHIIVRLHDIFNLTEGIIKQRLYVLNEFIRVEIVKNK